MAAVLVGAALRDGFPPMREQYFPSRAALEARVEAPVERLVAAAGSEPHSSTSEAALRR